MDPENVRKAKQPGSSAGECLYPISWSGWRALPLLSPDAGDKPYIDSADVKPTERRNPVSSAGECLWSTSWAGPTLAAL